jgi:hypothetical protein
MQDEQGQALDVDGTHAATGRGLVRIPLVNVPRRTPLPGKQLGTMHAEFDHVPILAAAASRLSVSLKRKER